MYFFFCSSSSSSESEGEEYFFFLSFECGSVVPCDEDLFFLATEEEAAEQEARMVFFSEAEREYRARLTRQVFFSVWCVFSNCSPEFARKAEECFFFQEIDRCGEVMEEFGFFLKCITLHPGFQDVCLFFFVLQVAALNLKTRSGFFFRTIYTHGRRTEAEFLRSVAYRKFTRLLWDYIGSSRRYPLPFRKAPTSATSFGRTRPFLN
ncbi:uncharacterized protein LOC111339612 [Stylophora pistillata]|uniref:uncharacterized protein LOC111339612 n=1 Tax=Stylophora pistillata TaxID=50429 RepID=UPI000C040C92|nr:uncharacterized protein LOC111339612 [Stylophora pistillata]